MPEHEQVTAMLTAKNAAPLDLEPARTALIIVDMQRYFTQPSFPFTDLFEKLSPGVCSGYLNRVRENVSEKLHQANLETLHVFGWVRATDDVIRMTQKARAMA
jgi:isochorismate hydrolase